ncbi:MAG: hypothetical protein A2Y15_02030 [Clostridiales bacterium GWF2_36_10]|nr:MAG: hypothetical protein A2Y15_02030 [Clostridiales bacterium GWF2_36_10]HAN20814.1 hypothetical protein [Clostridiales bacterium]
MKSNKKIALSGMMCALAVLIMLIGSLFQMLDLSAAAAAGLTVVFAMIELGKKYAFSIYAVSSILSFLLLPYKSPALIFAVFAGLYPILKAYLQRIRNKWLSLTAKLAVFNLFFTAIIYIGINLLGFSDDFYRFKTGFLGVVIYILGNIAFIVYDFALDKLILIYSLKIKRIFDKSFRV